MARSNRRDAAYTRTVLRIPEQALPAAILEFASPLVDALAPAKRRDPDAMRRVLKRAIAVWNQHVMAGPLWERPAQLLAARARLERATTSPTKREEFELLARQHARFRFDPRCVGKWSLAPSEATDGGFDLSCEMVLPPGAEPYVPPPIASRVGIGGRWLDEVRLRLGGSTHRGFTVEDHRAHVDEHGVVTLRTPALAAVQLFAMGVLPPIGGAADLSVGGRTLGPMVLAEVRGVDDLRGDRVVLRFDPA
jgi:hypothetical protein